METKLTQEPFPLAYVSGNFILPGLPCGTSEVPDRGQPSCIKEGGRAESNQLVPNPMRDPSLKLSQ